MAEIKGILQDLNPWWGGKFEIEFQDRDLYEQIQKFIPLRQIIAFTGLRRKFLLEKSLLTCNELQ